MATSWSEVGSEFLQELAESTESDFWPTNNANERESESESEGERESERERDGRTRDKTEERESGRWERTRDGALEARLLDLG